MIIITSKSKNTLSQTAFNIIEESKGRPSSIIDAIKDNMEALYYSSFLPQVEHVSDGNIQKELSSFNFKNMMAEEVLNDLSNILNDPMTDIADSSTPDGAAIYSYIYETVLPYFYNKYFQK